MFKFFRRKKDNKALAMNAEQEIATKKKMEMTDKAKEILDSLTVERRFHIMPVEFERRRA